MSDRITIALRLFADLAEAAGTRTLRVEVPAPATVRAVIDAAAAQHPAIAERRASLGASIGDRWVRGDDPVAPGDEVALIPPVSGG